jgi:hypothetical protein
LNLLGKGEAGDVIDIKLFNVKTITLLAEIRAILKKLTLI